MDVTFKVEGMTCGHCTGRVTRALEELRGTNKVEVSLEEKSAKVNFDENAVDLDTMKQAIEDTGYDVVNRR